MSGIDLLLSTHSIRASKVDNVELAPSKNTIPISLVLIDGHLKQLG